MSRRLPRKPCRRASLRLGPRLSATLIVAAALIVATADPVLADPAVPTHYRSVVNTVDPPPSGVAVDVVGGDAFLSVAASPGHTVEIPGYFGEAYLRIDEEGRVWWNQRSPARYINRDRYGISGVPDTADPRAEPEWEQIGSGGTFAWHDHRIHWMSADLPPTIGGDRAEIVFPWTVSITIDGVETEIRGELLWFPSTNPIGPILIGAVGILPFLAWRKGVPGPIAVIAAVTGAIALLVAVTQYAATPSFDRGAPVDAVVPSLAIAAAVAALWLRSTAFRTWALIGVSGAGLAWWAWGAADALTAPVLPSALPATLERSAVSLAVLVGLAVLVVAAYEFTRLLRTQSVQNEYSDV